MLTILACRRRRRRPRTAGSCRCRRASSCRRAAPARRACAGSRSPRCRRRARRRSSPRAASAAARFAVIDDLPTPPLPLPTAITRVVAEISVGGAGCEACQAGPLHHVRALFLGHLVVLDRARRARRARPAIFERTSLPIWPRSGQAAVVERDLHGHVAVGAHRRCRGPCPGRRSRRGARDRARPRACCGRRRSWEVRR